jgi:hypothetical protein
LSNPLAVVTCVCQPVTRLSHIRASDKTHPFQVSCKLRGETLGLPSGSGTAARRLALSGQAGGPAAPGVETVAAGPARNLGEPAAAQDAAATAVAATSFCAAGAQAVVWTKRAGVAAAPPGWQR